MLSVEDQVREAVFRYQFEVSASGLGNDASAYNLGLGHGDDRSAELLAGFEGHVPAIRPLCASEPEPGTAQVVDRGTGTPGPAFLITDVRLLDDREAEVDAEYQEASESAAGSTYRVVKANGQLRVEEARRHWIR